LLTQYDTEQSELEAKIAELQSAIDTFADDSLRADRFIETARRYTRFDELTATMLGEFIERVNVNEAVKTEGKRTQEIEIIFNFIGGFRAPDGFDILSPEERAAADAERERLDKKNAYERDRRKKQRESDWHKQDRVKKQAMLEAIAAKDVSELTEEEIVFAAEDAAKTEKRKAYMREYSRTRHQRNKETKSSEDAIVIEADDSTPEPAA
jgi:hypothetical protein